MKEKYLYAPILVLSFLLAGSQTALGETKYIPSDTSIGTWDAVTRTYTLTTDVSETIQIDEDNLTLDGVGHTVTGPAPGSTYGIYLDGRTGVTLKNLNVQKFSVGICLDSSSDNTLTGNTVSNNDYYGIDLYSSSSDNTLTGNTVSNNYYGICLTDSSNNTLTGNNANSNYVLGIVLFASSGNTLTDNNAKSNWYGIYLYSSSSDNSLTGNTVSNNHYGIHLYTSSDNQIYNNNFIDNSTQASVAGGSGNVFNLDKPVGGNYWSDWTSPDNDGDGFVDYPYVFTGGQDNLPRALQDGWLNQPPVADAGPDQVVEQESSEGTQVTLDGSGSTDPDSTPDTNNDIEFFDWYEGDTPLGSGETINYIFPLGEHTVTLKVTDFLGETDDDEVIIDVKRPLAPPVAINKRSAIDELEGAKIGDKKRDKEVDKAIEHINKSLGIGEKHDLWEDDSHLDPKHGKKVFDEEKKAVKKLMHLMDKKHTPEMVKQVCQVVVDYLIEADYMLADIAHSEALAGGDGDPHVARELEKCAEEFAKAQKELYHTKKDGTPDPHYDKAIDHYKHAWEHAQKALDQGKGKKGKGKK